MIPTLRSCIFSASRSFVTPVSNGAMASRNFSVSGVRFEPDGAAYSEQGDNQQPQFGEQQPRRRFGPSINRVELLGNLARDPVDKMTKSGAKFTTFSLFTNVEFRRFDGTSGEHTELHEVHAFGGLANYVLSSNIRKGSKVFVSGRLHYLGGQLRSDGLRSPKIATISAEVVQQVASRKNRLNDGEIDQPIEQDQH